jgi:hypothetical protein
VTEWPARLGRDGRKVLCGRLVNGVARCDGQLGERVADVSLLGFFDDPIFVFSPGTGWFREADGTLRMGKRARQRVARGEPPSLRRGYRTIDPNLPKIEGDGLSEILPLRVRCPSCMTVNVVDTHLGIVDPA